MLRNAFISRPEASELKGSAISASVALVERLEEVIGKLEAALVRQQAENARLRLVETAAASALADLDALLAESGPLDVTQTAIGKQG
jgi:hypothetical protein